MHTRSSTDILLPVRVHSCCLPALMKNAVWRNECMCKRGSKFEWQNTGAIFLWALKIFYMQLMSCSKWRMVPVWKAGFVTLWKCDLLLNVTYLLVHSHKYSVTFLSRQHKHYIFCTSKGWGGLCFVLLRFCAVWILFNSVVYFCRLTVFHIQFVR